VTVSYVPPPAPEQIQARFPTPFSRYRSFHSLVVRYLCLTLGSLVLLGYGSGALAWSEPVHNTIGILAIDRLQDNSRNRLESIVGKLDDAAISKACNWPDVIRDEDAWDWSKPQHYVNIPRGNFSYLVSRDCPDQLCATQAIKRYARELVDGQNNQEQHWQAFAWLCHLVADLHQPLHAGFADDRGGNSFEIKVRNETMNLHHFWDHELIIHNAGNAGELIRLLKLSPPPQVPDTWFPQQVDEWTDESHALAAEKAYPPSPEIDEPWENEVWRIAVERINLAASRLALVIETILQDKE